jgi:ABC-type Fe3+-hydroxamate transport system substrate-binding protein
VKADPPEAWRPLPRRAPQRIVSLVPSDTYSLIALGVADRIVGRTRYCVEPAEIVRRIPEVGGTKNPDVDAVLDARPDLVVANQEENTKKDVERLAAAGVAVLLSFPKRVAEGLAHVARLVQVLEIGGEPLVKDLLRGYYRALREAEAARARAVPVRTFFPIWMDPLMTVNSETFISDALDLAGAANVFADRVRRYPLAADLGRASPAALDKVEGRDTRYPRVTWEEVVSRAPELVLLPDEPHDFSEQDRVKFLALEIPAARDGARVVRVDGKDFGWYGAKSLEALGRTRALVESATGAPRA